VRWKIFHTYMTPKVGGKDNKKYESNFMKIIYNSIFSMDGICNWCLKHMTFMKIFVWPSYFWFLVVMSPGQKFLTLVGSGQPFMVWVWILKISPKNVKFFNFFPFGSKKIALGWVGEYPGWSWVGLLFTVGQKLALVGLRPISNF